MSSLRTFTEVVCVRACTHVCLCVTGGAPDISAMTGGKFSSGLEGCVRNLSLMNARPGEQLARPIELQVPAENGINVGRCSS